MEEAKQDIKDREDVLLLVRSFYARVQKDALLGPIFDRFVTDWESHYELLTDFWESNLFFRKKYHGDPMGVHVEMDRKEGATINELHFGTWINLWYTTVDSLFSGEVANIAKNRARNMGTFLHLKIFEARSK